MSQTNQRKALGKGLEQLFSSEQLDFNQIEREIVVTTPESEVVSIPLSEIRSNPYQPRIHFDEEALNELASSIKEHGVLEPIIVKKSIKGYEIVAGERRTRASKLAGKDKIPAIIKDFDDRQMMEIALLENIQRENLSPIEEAKGYKKFMDTYNVTQEDVAKRFGKSRSHITNLLGLLSLPKEVQNDVLDGNITMSHARVLSKMYNEDQIIDLSKKIKEKNMSVRELEDIARGGDIEKKKPIKKTVGIVTTKHKVYENSMRDLIGTKVSISSNKITIPYDSLNDLDRIMEILGVEISD